MPVDAYHRQAVPTDAWMHGTNPRGYGDWYVTVGEFQRILTALYLHDYVLIDIRTLVNTPKEGGKRLLSRAPLLLPPGKKPLIICIDDAAYDKDLVANGTVRRLILDANGQVATESVLPDGRLLVAADNEIVPNLDHFVQAHPDFSPFGAKGTLALTGFAGVLGYRTMPGAPYAAAESEAARVVIAQLKAIGWSFS